MAKEQYLIKNVEVKYPRLDQPYDYSPTAGREGKGGFVPSAPSSSAKYSTHFIMDEAMAEALYNKMDAAYSSSRKTNWPKDMPPPSEVFAETDDGRFEGKTNIASSYNGNTVKPPTHFDAKMVVLKEGFQLTRGSIVNLVVELVPYNFNGHGVNLRIRQVQVLQLAEQVQSASSLLQVEDGYTADTPTFGPKNDVADDMPDIEEAVEEPKKVVSMKKEKAATPASDIDMKGLVSKWGSKRKAD